MGHNIWFHDTPKDKPIFVNESNLISAIMKALKTRNAMIIRVERVE
jgi:hypothetical protein